MSGHVLVTGGAGFVGTNVAAKLAECGHRVLLLDNLARSGVDRNLDWLTARYQGAVEFVRGDVRDAAVVAACVEGASAVFHFAAQVAVTTSLTDPVADFEVNARGTLNVLEALRKANPQAALFFTSTNKVYGDLDDVGLRRSDTRYVPTDPRILSRGIGEDRRLSFHSPYGCSKGTADQYVLDYARSYGLRAVVFRMSCIYGPHQFGTEDQGWVAHFLIRALDRETITLYGDGRQVRDILFVEDLVNAFLLAWSNLERVSGQAFNIGGGPRNAVSLMELLHLIADITGQRPAVEYEEWRIGDQRYYVSDTRKFAHATGWQPASDVPRGVAALAQWLAQSRQVALPRAAAAHFLQEGAA